ncbi:MAG: aspartate aminotransferase family protein, partial [Candidatus Omnitrophica bacterium]|nr:aspartate aminotransferase family protein [Candidatus Omnitrophota bacterium]
PRVVANMKKQLARILHVSNNFYNDVQPLLAKKIVENSFPGKVFFCNSGAEANEAAIKLARRYGNPSRYEIITMEKSFHGRTIATITATGQEKVKTGFHPLPEGFKHVPFNDIGALKAAVTEKTVAVMMEPIQGEGGINVAGMDYMKEVSELCRERKMLFILDEVQTGMGRTGKMFAYQHYGIIPDAMSLAKSLGGGMPIGALVVKEEHAGVLTPGTHASTFGGSPITCAAARGVFEAIEEGKLLENAVRAGGKIRKVLKKMARKYPLIKEVLGIGLMIGVRMDMDDAGPVYEACLRGGLLINCTQKNVLRIMPPVTVKPREIKIAMDILDKAIGSVA